MDGKRVANGVCLAGYDCVLGCTMIDGAVKVLS